jgi:ubiquitin conjugation factor E4 B
VISREDIENLNNQQKTTISKMETDDLILSEKTVSATLTGLKKNLLGSEMMMDTTEDCKDVLNNNGQKIEVFISRVLNASWATFCEGNTSCTNAASAYLDGIFNENNLKELISEVIFEVISQFYDGELTRTPVHRETSVEKFYSSVTPKKRIKQTISSDESCQMEVEDTTETFCYKPKLAKFSSNRVAALDYLISCFNRLASEETAKRNQDIRDILGEVIAEIRKQILHYSLLILDGHFVALMCAEASINAFEKSPLLQLLYENVVPPDFIQHLIAVSGAKSEQFKDIFSKVLNDLHYDMKNLLLNEAISTEPIECLKTLVDIQTLGSNERPICDVIAQLPNFCPVLCTEIGARELSRSSFLSPFLSISILSGENNKFAEHYFQEKTVDRMFATSIQNKLDHIRSMLHGIFLGLISHTGSRQETLKFFAEILRTNEKRIQYNADERKLARDGFMLNIMSVLQYLAVKIKLDRIDIYYPYQPDSLSSDYANDTKLRFTAQEFADWLELTKQRQWDAAPKFVTQCWFFTLNSQHLAIIPAIQRYQKHLRAIKELQRLVDELDATKGQWENTPMARKNKYIRDRWAQQIKKLTRSKQTCDIEIIDPTLLRRCLQVRFFCCLK